MILRPFNANGSIILDELRAGGILRYIQSRDDDGVFYILAPKYETQVIIGE